MNVQWQRYKELELISGSIAQAQPRSFHVLFPLIAIWRVLLSALSWEHFYEHRTDYLERCWALSDSSSSCSTHQSSLHQLLRLMDLEAE
ncbi:hypothetical protein OsccyDRAFT_4747 [Leptolyngbyaceae cyanobacterium JSC-12]|nr:hypothetical protein OsccyDRAFT_4747 [Leptolyngbyaceae cyanobacterium JSC-12]